MTSCAACSESSGIKWGATAAQLMQNHSGTVVVIAAHLTQNHSGTVVLLLVVIVAYLTQNHSGSDRVALGWWGMKVANVLKKWHTSKWQIFIPKTHVKNGISQFQWAILILVIELYSYSILKS